jgi:hypothetical protein
MALTNETKPTTTLTNITRVAFAELWSLISTTWASETRTWSECGSLLTTETKIGAPALFIVDSYTDYQNIDTLGYGYKGFGQSFTGTDGVLNSVSFLFANTFKPYSRPYGDIYAKIYAHTGTFGTTSKPTGSALATSDAISALELSTALSYIPFVFTGTNKITLATGTPYVVTIEYSSIPTNADTLAVGYRYTSPGHSGNGSYKSGSAWYTSGTVDYCFFVYADLIIPTITNTPKP